MQDMTPAIEKHGSDADERPRLSFDRPLHAAIARLTAGVAPAALFQVYTDWAQHLLFSPDKQIELVREAANNWMHFLEYCPKALVDPDCEACAELAPDDKRFAHDAWHRWPFNAISQGFLFTQQWWHHATTGVKGVSAHHEDVISFVARQMLDVVSPANFLSHKPRGDRDHGSTSWNESCTWCGELLGGPAAPCRREEARRCRGLPGWPRRCGHAR